MREIDTLILFPNQLYGDKINQNEYDKIFLVEEDSFFTRFKFHKKKLILHRASMKSYQDRAKSEVFYIENDRGKTLDKLFNEMKKQEIKEVCIPEILDYVLEDKLILLSKKYEIVIKNLNVTGFLSPRVWLSKYFSIHGFNQTSFYIAQRKRLNLLVDNDKPVGGKWSYDSENRIKLPRDFEIPEVVELRPTKYVDEATSYILEKFPDNPGYHIEFIYPINPEEANIFVKDFIDNRLEYFGTYQDALSERGNYLFHSLLSSSLNIGIISPDYVIKETLKKHAESPLSLNSLEGFIRQIIGWREYIRAVYIKIGREIGDINYWEHRNQLQDFYYSGVSGIKPLDDTVKKVLKTAYAHHIERLMILGNFMLLTGIDPDEAYRWFMEMFIDSYDWVMKPNVYLMSQYSDGGTITTKPYFSSSKYILRMSDYRKNEWSKEWDALFWSFINKNREKIDKNPRMKVLLYNLEKIPLTKMKEYNRISQKYTKKE